MAEWSRLTATDRGSGQPEARSGAGRGLWSARWPEAELSRLTPAAGGDGAGRAVLHAAGAAGGRPPPALVRAQGARAHPRAAPVPHLRAGGLTLTLTLTPTLTLTLTLTLSLTLALTLTCASPSSRRRITCRRWLTCR
eukprot:scaffold115988_cov57-Phaeocystis_antarctica.AAC.2